MPRKPKGYSPVNGQPIPEGKPFTTGDSRAREMQLRGVKAKKERKALREELIAILSTEVKVDGKMKQVQEAVSTALVKQAMKGNTRAFEVIRDTIGEKPVENVNFVMPDYSALDDAFNQLKGDKDATGG